jgi:CBS-domain-containing membrane protein
MLVAEALNTDIRVLTTDDSGIEALEKMDELQVNTLPIVNYSTGEIVGQINRERLLYTHRGDGSISAAELEEPVVIFNDQHLFYAVHLMLQHEMRLLPVVDKQSIFQGIIQKHHVLELLGQMLNLTEYGSVIIVRLNQQDFTLSEIVQLIETEGGKILGITVETPNAEDQAYEVSIKLNLQDASRAASALRRYGYTVLTAGKGEAHNIDLETRAGEFLKYLDI